LIEERSGPQPTLKKNSVYKIPAGEIKAGKQLCLDNARGFWQGATYVAAYLGLHIATGLSLLAIEELGKYKLLENMQARRCSVDESELTIKERDFKSHPLKLELAKKLFSELKIPIEQAKIPLSQKERERRWFVNWDEEARKFKLDVEGLTIGNEAAFRKFILTALRRIDSLRE